MSGPNGSASYQYNDQGIRVRAITGTTTYYLVDANNHTGYAQVLEELSAPGGTPNMSYVLGDDVLAQSSGSTASYLLYDGHGSTRQVINNTLGVASKYNNDAYGVTQGNSYNPSGSSLRYCGEQYDSTLQMYNLRARYYDPSNGRFNASDSFMGYNDDPQSLHKYNYANSDPINGLDPSGHDLVEVLAVMAIISIMAAIVLPVANLTVAGAMIGNASATGPSSAYVVSLDWSQVFKFQNSSGIPIVIGYDVGVDMLYIKKWRVGTHMVMLGWQQVILAPEVL